MPPVICRNGKPLTPRIGSNIPFNKQEESQYFRKIQDLISEYNARSKKRIAVCSVDSEGSLIFMGTSKIVATVLQSNVVTALREGSTTTEDWFAETQRESFAVPLVELPTPAQFYGLDEAGCELLIGKILDLWNYPYSHHFSISEDVVPYCWPKKITPRSPGTLTVNKDNHTGLPFRSRKSFLLFILKVILFSYFHNLLFKTLGLVISTEDGVSSFSAESKFTTLMPFDIDEKGKYTNDVKPLLRKKNTVQNSLLRKRGSEEVVVTTTTDDNTENGGENSTQKPRLGAVKLKVRKTGALEGMPPLAQFDTTAGKDEQRSEPSTSEGKAESTTDEKDPSRTSSEASKPVDRLKIRKYVKNVPGQDPVKILCACLTPVSLSSIKTFKCSCGNYSHLTCAPSNDSTRCISCALKT